MPIKSATFDPESVEKMNSEEDERPRKYMEQYLQKKEANGKWIEYWVILRGCYLLFYAHKCEANELRDSFRGSIELTPGSKCTIGKRKKYSFPFFLSTSKARYYFKSPTLLLRHQWIHSMSLSATGAFPESLPNALPAIPSHRETQSSQSDEEISKDMKDTDESREKFIEETLIDIEDSPEEEEASKDLLPSKIIVVKSRSPGSDDVVDFLSGERKLDTSNFQVTNFMNARNDTTEVARNPKIGIDNLSFEEEESAAARRRDVAGQQSNGVGSWKSRSSTPQASQVPTFSFSPSTTRSNPSGRVVRSAGSIRSQASESLSPTPSYRDVYLSVRTSSNNLSVTGNRFSRHLVSSAPDLFGTSTA